MLPRHVVAKTAGGIILCLFFICSVSFADVIPVSRFASPDGLAGWDTKSFKGRTLYRLVKDGDIFAVKADSSGTASGLIRKIRFNPGTYRYLTWRWKITRTVRGGDENSRSGDDCAARIYVIFPGFFFWQTRALSYIWSNKLAKGDWLPSAFTSNVRMIAVESGDSMSGVWMTESRDLRADFLRVFGEEPPEAGAIGIMTDSDNTNGRAEAWYGDIQVASDVK